jgi:hypothetical protein
MMRNHPSTSTNSRSLKGSEMTLGESMLIPIASRMFAITMSMMTNGMKTRNPTSNASFNWLVTNAGMITWKSSLERDDAGAGGGVAADELAALSSGVVVETLETSGAVVVGIIGGFAVADFT